MVSLPRKRQSELGSSALVSSQHKGYHGQVVKRVSTVKERKEVECTLRSTMIRDYDGEAVTSGGVLFGGGVGLIKGRVDEGCRCVSGKTSLISSLLRAFEPFFLDVDVEH